MSSPSVPIISLNNGQKIPSVGLGCWLGKPANEKEGNTETKEMVENALKAGYRHFDTASGYGNEEAVGRAIAESGVDRGELFVTTKLTQKDHGKVREAFEESLKRLGTEYIDLSLVHWPQAIDPATGETLPPSASPTIPEVWAEMEKLLDTGKVRSIGVSNFSPKNIDWLLEKANVVPAVNQVELHAYLPQNELWEYCKLKGIHMTAYCPLGQYNSPILKEPAVVAIAETYHKTASQVLLAWLVQRGNISVVPKSSNPGRLAQNIDLLTLTGDEMNVLSQLHTEPGKYRSLCGYSGNGLTVPGSVYGWRLKEDLGWDVKAFGHYWK